MLPLVLENQAEWVFEYLESVSLPFKRVKKINLGSYWHKGKTELKYVRTKTLELTQKLKGNL